MAADRPPAAALAKASAAADPSASAPTWMRHWLIAAGVYNLAWGGLTVLLPGWLFDLTGMERPLYPFIWQCVGMIVGVYGVGYLAASADPLRHWPIVLVGLLGKIFGPLGYVSGVLQGDVPPAFGVTLPTNDLLWWIPFALILRQAWRAGQTPAPAGCNGAAWKRPVDEVEHARIVGGEAEPEACGPAAASLPHEPLRPCGSER